MSRNSFFQVIALLIFPLPIFAQTNDVRIKFTRGQTPIEHLQLSEQAKVLSSLPIPANGMVRIKLRGEFKKVYGKTLLDSDLRPISQDSSQAIVANALFSAPIRKVSFTEIDDQGKILREDIQIEILDFQKLYAAQASAPTAPVAPVASLASATKKVQSLPNRSLHFGIGLDSSYVQYVEQSSLKDPQKFNQLGLTLKANVEYGTPSRPLSFDFSGYVTLVPLTRNIQQLNVRFIGMNAVANYCLPVRIQNGRLSVGAGFAYSTMLISTQDEDLALGYKRLGGPQVRTKYAKTLAGNRVFTAFAKASLISSKLTLLDTKSFGLGGGFSYQFNLTAKQAISIDLSYEKLRIQIPDRFDFSATSNTYAVGFSLPLN